MNHRPKNALRWLFPLGFICACVLFWWSPTILAAFFNVGIDMKAWTLEISAAALCVFLLGYLFSLRLIRRPLIAPRITTMASHLAFQAVLVSSVPAFVVGGKFALYRAGLAYGTGDDIPILTQAILYLHMFFAYMFLGSVPTCTGADKRKILWTIAFVLTPRILITLHWGRFFAGQTVVAILFIALARGWVKLSVKRGLQLGALALLVFLGPIITRAHIFDREGFEEIAGSAPQLVQFFSQGSTLHFFQVYHDDLKPTCPPLLVSLAQRTVPFKWLNVCTIQVGDARGVPATVENLLTREDSNNLATGTGSIFIFGPYLAGGVPGVILASFIFGLCCRWWVERLAYASLFAGIWAECLVRSLLAPRGSLGYEFQRIPSLLLATFLFILLCQVLEILQTRNPASLTGMEESCP